MRNRGARARCTSQPSGAANDELLLITARANRVCFKYEEKDLSKSDVLREGLTRHRYTARYATKGKPAAAAGALVVGRYFTQIVKLKLFRASGSRYFAHRFENIMRINSS